MASVPTNKLQNWLTTLGRQRQQVGIGLLVLAAVCVGVAIFLVFKHDDWPNTSWGDVTALGFVAVGALAGAVWCLTNFSLTPTDEDHGRFTVAFLGTATGLGLLVLAVVRTYSGWEKYIAPGLEAWQGKETWWYVWVCLLANVAGLLVLFLTVLAVRSDEYKSRGMRVASYGYIAVQSCIMLLDVLIFVNVLAYFLFPTPADWTASGLYTLNEQSQAILKSLKQPVKIYSLTRGRESDSDIELLLSNCQAVTDKVQTETVLRDRNIKRMEELRSKYQLPLDSSGLLVTYETPQGKSDYQFIRSDEMYDAPKMRGARGLFKGEAALMTAIDYLSEGKSRATIYFTQGNGELDITGTSGRPEDGGAALAERLRKTNCDVKPLNLNGLGAQAAVPDDASVVVVAGPTQTLPESAVAALRKYMTTPNSKKKKGRLVVLAGATADPDRKGKMVATGLEGLLAEFSVDLTGSRVLVARERNANPVNVRVTGSSTSRNPVAEVLSDVILPMGNVRVVKRGDAGLRGGPSYQADEFLGVPLIFPTWTSDDLGEDPGDLLRRARQEGDKNALDKINKQLSKTPVPVGVAVSETGEGGPTPMNPHAMGGDSTPRLVVIGNARFVSDSVLAESSEGATYSFAVVSSSLAWLREKPTGIGIPPVDRKIYQMKADTNITRMIVLPGALMGFGIFGLGIATWLVRRR